GGGAQLQDRGARPGPLHRHGSVPRARDLRQAARALEVRGGPPGAAPRARALSYSSRDARILREGKRTAETRRTRRSAEEEARRLGPPGLWLSASRRTGGLVLSLRAAPRPPRLRGAFGLRASRASLLGVLRLVLVQRGLLLAVGR